MSVSVDNKEEFSISGFLRRSAFSLVSVAVASALVFSVYFSAIGVGRSSKKPSQLKNSETTTQATHEDKKRYKGGIYVPETTIETPDVVYETTTAKPKSELNVENSSDINEKERTTYRDETTKLKSNWNELFSTTRNEQETETTENFPECTTEVTEEETTKSGV